MEAVNTNPEGSSNTTQENTLQPTQEVSSNPSPEGPIENDSIQVQQDADLELEAPPKKLRSDVWPHFRRIKVGGLDKAECIYCNSKLSAVSTNGTTHLRTHLNRCVQKKIKTRGHDKGQPFIMPKISQGKQEMGVGNYDPENTKKEIAHAIIMHDYPLSIVDHIGFRRILTSLQPLFHIPSRNTIKKEILKVYDFERECAMKMLESHDGRVAITSDMWTSGNQKRGYMAVTAHYIDGSWTLQNQLLRFIYVPAPHTAERLCQALVDCFMDWNIDRKLSTITLDNCTTNDKMINDLKGKLALESLLRNGSLLHMRCCAHILNLIVKEGLEVVNDGVEKIRDSVAYWNATPKRHEKFEEAAKQLKVSYTKRLALDCPTRWNSTYKMLQIAIEYKDVFIRLKQREPQYKCLPSNLQWQFAKDVCACLALFNDITELISGTKYPTANMYFPKICQIKLEITRWKNSPNEMISKMAANMMVKFESYWSVIHDIMGVAAVLDPQYKMALLDFYFPKLYGHDSDTQISRIQELCYDLLADYQKNKDTGGSTPLIGTRLANKGPLAEFDAYIQQRKQSRSSSVKSELDHYLNEDVIARVDDFDILSWWKANGAMYPTLKSIAKDVLAIPISTVASESAFSTSGRILGPYRSRLNWTTLEALMCARSWLWAAETNGTLNDSVTQEYATVLNELDSEDEAELMSSISTYNFED